MLQIWGPVAIVLVLGTVLHPELKALYQRVFFLFSGGWFHGGLLRVYGKCAGPPEGPCSSISFGVANPNVNQTPICAVLKIQLPKHFQNTRFCPEREIFARMEALLPEHEIFARTKVFIFVRLPPPCRGLGGDKGWRLRSFKAKLELTDRTLP